MANDAKKDTAVKAERKKPVRKSPVQKDYPNKLAWLKALTEYEEAQSAVSNKAKVERLDKRIAAKRAQVTELGEDLAKLISERATLTGEEQPADAGTSETDEAGTPAA
jgi:hypothetical protein